MGCVLSMLSICNNYHTQFLFLCTQEKSNVFHQEKQLFDMSLNWSSGWSTKYTSTIQVSQNLHTIDNANSVLLKTVRSSILKSRFYPKLHNSRRTKKHFEVPKKELIHFCAGIDFNNIKWFLSPLPQELSFKNLHWIFYWKVFKKWIMEFTVEFANCYILKL